MNSSDLRFRGTLPFKKSAYLAPMTTTIFLCELLLFRSRGEGLGPFPVFEDDLIATGKELKWLVHLVEMVELYRAGFVKDFEIRRVHKVAHLDVVNFEALGLFGIRTLVCICGFRIGGRRHQ